jgi:beta-N-acetylhexosaminidase
MNLKSQLGQMFFIGISGHSLTSEEKDFIVENDIGGIILFSRNVKDPEQISKLTSDIQSLSQQTESKLPFVISIDMEGGRVHRLKSPFTIWPAMKHLGLSDSPQLAFDVGKALASELAAVGINLDYTPCLDVLLNPKNEIIGDRSFGSDPDHVAKIASGLIRGFKKAGVMTCVKHFPGHGYTSIDSHEDLPIDDRNWDKLFQTETSAYKKVFKSKVEFLMTAHILSKNIDPEFPVTLSEKFLNHYLQDELGYRNLIMTDDLDMKALSKNKSAADLTYMAYNAGADIFLFCNQPESHISAVESMQDRLGQLNPERINTSFQKILDIKNQFQENWNPPDQDVIGCDEHQALVQQLLSFK